MVYIPPNTPKRRIKAGAAGVLPNFPYLAVQLYKQQTDYTCGPASLLMAMSHFGHIPKEVTELTLRQQMRIKKGVGVTRYWMGSIAKRYGFSVKCAKDGTLDILRSYLNKGWPCIVMYKDSPSSFHYSVVVSASPYSQTIVLADPWSRSFVQWDEQKFITSWITPRGDKAWWMAIHPDPNKKGAWHQAITTK